jgi:hypothetical protein
MSKRFYLCDIVGDGTDDNPYRPAVANYAVNWVASIETGPDGKPLHSDCLVLVNTDNHLPLRADKRIDAMPDMTLDGKFSAVSVAAKNAMSAAMVKRGISTQFLSDTVMGYREVLQTIGKQRSEGFEIDKFDIK